MYKFVLDADAAIKLAKAGVLKLLVTNAECLMPSAVYEEVLKGKEKMREDAFITEAIVNEGSLKVINIEPEFNETNLGKGEKAAMAACRKYAGDAVISDDAKFIARLKQERLLAITPANAVVWLVENQKITKDGGVSALDKMRTFVSKEAYNRARMLIGGETK